MVERVRRLVERVRRLVEQRGTSASRDHSARWRAKSATRPARKKFLESFWKRCADLNRWCIIGDTPSRDPRPGWAFFFVRGSSNVISKDGLAQRLALLDPRSRCSSRARSSESVRAGFDPVGESADPALGIVVDPLAAGLRREVVIVWECAVRGRLETILAKDRVVLA